MKKTIKLLSILFLFGAIFMSCEGPAGIDGVDGVVGADGTAVCMTCHNAGTVYAAKVDQFNNGVANALINFSTEAKPAFSGMVNRQGSPEEPPHPDRHDQQTDHADAPLTSCRNDAPESGLVTR